MIDDDVRRLERLREADHDAEVTLSRVRVRHGTADEACRAFVAALDVRDFIYRGHEQHGGSQHATGLFEHRLTGLSFALIRGGRYSMGSPLGEWPMTVEEEGPTRLVTIGALLVCQTACTQTAWERVMGNRVSQFDGPHLPVEGVSWHDAQEFCSKAGLRLPSEAEWEFACRAETTTAFCFGPTITPGQANVIGSFRECDCAGECEGECECDCVGSCKCPRRDRTVDVYSFQPNGFGLFNIHGNVLEWCQDEYQIGYQGAPCDGSPWEGHGSGRRVARGGSWVSSASDCRSASRWAGRAGHQGNYLGFRPVHSIMA